MKILFDAIRALPKKWISNNTKIAYNEKFVVAVNGKYPPIAYMKKIGWKKLDSDCKDKSVLRITDQQMNIL
jgi:hypothetical protein